MSYVDASLHDTASPEWRDICFARWICRLDGFDARAAFLAGFAKRHRNQPAMVDYYKDLVNAQWRIRAQWAPRAENDLFAEVA